MSKGPSKLDRFNWNPIVPGLILAWWLSRLAARGWNFTEMGWFRVVGLCIMILWFGLAVYNYLSGGKLLEFLYSDDDREFEVPETFAALKKQIDLPETPLTKAIEENLPAGRDLEKAIGDLDDVEITEQEEGMVVVTAYRELCESDDPRSAVLLEQFRNSGSPEVFGGFFRYGMPLVHERLRTLRSRSDEPPEHDFDREEFGRQVGKGNGGQHEPRCPSPAS